LAHGWINDCCRDAHTGKYHGTQPGPIELVIDAPVESVGILTVFTGNCAVDPGAAFGRRNAAVDGKLHTKHGAIS
jgi:hypothetical protein